jgi:transcriptional regulator with XRE-family HTH domain
MNKQTANHQTGERLHQVRKHRNISQGQIASSIGVSVGTVQNYEHGRTHITTDRLEQLAWALQCEPTDLLAPPGTPPPRYHRLRYGHKRKRTIAGPVILAAGLSAPGGPPQFALDLEQFADKLDRIDADDLA